MDKPFSLPELITDFHHDFRAVLANLVGYVDHLIEGAGGPLSPVQSESLEIILKNANRLKLMADNLARAAQEDMIVLITGETIDLRKVVERSLLFHSLSARDAGVRIGSSWEGSDFRVQGSELLLVSLVDNLLSNAIKFTPAGGSVAVSGRRSGGAVDLLVEDTGIGIPADDLPQVFKRGFRGTAAGGGHREGLGLGLSICQRIAEAHGARIQVTSWVGEGTRVEVIFPGSPF